MKPIRHDITNPRGDSFTFSLKVPLDSVVDSIYFSIKKNKTDESYVVHKSIGSGIEDVTEVSDEFKWYTVSLSPEDTNNVEPGDYYHDFQVKMDGEVQTLMEGTFKITSDVTREV